MISTLHIAVIFYSLSQFIIDKIEDPNEELLRWTEIICLKKDVYCKEFKFTSNHFDEKKLLR
ncbi:hypothetical protein C1646_698947, partial [Rhizophagus diaphanus]